MARNLVNTAVLPVGCGFGYSAIPWLGNPDYASLHTKTRITLRSIRAYYTMRNPGWTLHGTAQSVMNMGRNWTDTSVLPVGYGIGYRGISWLLTPYSAALVLVPKLQLGNPRY